ncbi:hypothetical protein DICPUDRAFT_159452 [Dictyostelium purpureum]|uniref:Uncharacterized protein n=1 Tax=Dictyostelium purpureum TaxID=5786 RepID=F1A459_DICPU|nr:uncharacterized protein DICPUDRAFT_159452 [Dictyostelium purpureum]EGC29024.1 hypothetical protein DICPUDRAFT_159452 [Dictyostelium purpureum]|eukprot:XP_003294452.1 hypothetical protein DICPUDRAFT_159452 [Dictyostelium purpureum]
MTTSPEEESIELQQPQQPKRRNRIGTKNKELYNWDPIEYEQNESSFATQEYIQDRIRKDECNTNYVLSMPSNHDINLWQYEQIRQFTLELNHFTALFKDFCNQTTCPSMKATDDWLFLCASHKQTQECSAIDYIIHTLDSTSAILNSDKHFPKRIEIPATSIKHFQSICRRLYRIFAHAFYHHRELYNDFESKTNLHKRFCKFCLQSNLLPKSAILVKE